MVAHICPKCKEVFSAPYKLRNHLNRKFKCDEGEFPCPTCPKRFHHAESCCRHKKDCTGPRAPVAEELEEQLAAVNEELQQSQQQLEEAKAIAEINADKILKAIVKQPRKPNVTGPEFVYAVWSNGNRTIKAGYWKGTLKALRQRYVTTFGKNMQIMLFQCQNRILTERLMFDKLKPWHIESELYSMECLSVLPTVISSLSSVSDAVQRSEQTEGGYLFTKPEVPEGEKSEASTISSVDTASAESSTEVELLKVKLEQLEIREEKLALREQLLLAKQATQMVS